MAYQPSKKLVRLARNLRKQDTWAEALLWKWLRDRRFSAYKFRRQHTFGPHILDFFCAEAFLNIELDGSQHGFPNQKAMDQERDAWLAKAGVKVLRFWNSRLRRDKEFVRDIIWRELQARAPQALPKYCEAGRGALGVESDVGDDVTSPSPSPRPSPLGRGSDARRFAKGNEAGFTEASL